MTGGFIAGNIVAGVIGLLCLLAVAGGLYKGIRQTGYDPDAGFAVAAIGFVCLLLTAGVWLLASWPLAYEYHHWIPKHGTVTKKVGSRILSDGDGNINQKFVVVVDGQPYGVNDTRAALLEPGDRVSLKCKKAYDFGVPREAHGWDCKWNGGPVA